MTYNEIWAAATNLGLVELLGTTGKTPEATLGAILYTTVKRPDSPIAKVGTRPAKFILKTVETSLSAAELQKQAVLEPPSTAAKAFCEWDLHPLLVCFADAHFGAHCRTIVHQKSQKKGDKHNQWVHPDIVGFSLTTQEWPHAVVQLAQSIGAAVARVLSFELKTALEFSTLREYFFQAVSNSSWAHEGYLVASSIDEDPEFRDELRRLSQSFGIGVIQLDLSNPLDSAIIYPARERSEIDWDTVNRIVAINPDFAEFIAAVANSIKINQPAVPGFDPVLEGTALDDYLKKLGKK